MYGAFAAFRQRRCSPYQPPGDTQKGGVAGGAAAAPAASTKNGGSGTEVSALARQAALADRLVTAAEVLHIWRPVAYALALRRCGGRRGLARACMRAGLQGQLAARARRPWPRGALCWSLMSRVLRLRRWGRTSWKPWLLSLGIDALSMQLGAAGARVSQVRRLARRACRCPPPSLRCAAHAGPPPPTRTRGRPAQSASWFGGAARPSLGPSLVLLRCLQQTRWAADEERELSARRLRLLVYLLRDPLFARYTQARAGPALAGAGQRGWAATPGAALAWACGRAPLPHIHLRLQAALDKWVRGSARVPLVGWLSGRAVEILVGVQRYYTYVERMAAS